MNFSDSFFISRKEGGHPFDHSVIDGARTSPLSNLGLSKIFAIMNKEIHQIN